MSRLLRLWGPLARLPKSRPISRVYTTTEFDLIFQRECALCDRTRSSVALLVVQCSNRAELERAADSIRPRLRVSDVLGELGAARLGVLCPDTDAAGASTLAEAVLQLLTVAKLKCTVDVYSYPQSEPPSDDDGRGDDPDDDGPGGSNGFVGDLPSDVDAEGNPIGKRERSREAAGMMAEQAQLDGAIPVQDLTPFLIQPMPLWKRALDIVVSTSLLVLLTPLFLAVAVAIKLTSPGPIIFRQQRAGEGGRPFAFYKFRSMYLDADRRRAELEAQNEADGPVFKIRNDPRMTPIGRIIRRTSIDELPQLVNVLRGDMTLVGPRPPILEEVKQYDPWQRRRLYVKGGLTCIWQVSGRSEIGFTDWVRMDVRYTRERNLLMDLDLLRRTALAVVSGRGAY